MKSFISILLVALFFIVVTVAAAGADDTEFNPAGSLVINLSEKTFDEELKKKEFTLVEFYAPWCPHCKTLVPEYEKLAKAIEEDAELKDKITIAKVDCEEHKSLPGKFGVQGFPTLKLFKNGQLYKDFEGARNADSIKNFILKKTGPVAIPVESVEAAKEFIAKKRSDTPVSVVVGQFKSQDSENRKLFLKAAEIKQLDNFLFVEIVNESTVDKEQFSVYPLFEEDAAIDSVDFANAEKFILKKGFPVVDELNGETFSRFAEAKVPLVIAFAKLSNADEKKQVVSVMNEIAKRPELEGRASFTYSDGEVYGEQLKIMGGNPEKLPGIAIMNLEKRTNFPYSGKLDANELAEWVISVLEGKCPPHVRSQPIPEKQEESVYVLVGKNFDEIVFNDEKDVLVEFYAPWCGHCKTLAPKYEELAQAFAGAKDKLVIAKLDATENDTPNSGVEVQGFPTLYFYPAGSKKAPIAYEGSRSVEDLTTFIKKHAVAAKDLVGNVNASAAAAGDDKKKDEL